MLCFFFTHIRQQLFLILVRIYKCHCDINTNLLMNEKCSNMHLICSHEVIWIVVCYCLVFTWLCIHHNSVACRSVLAVITWSNFFQYDFISVSLGCGGIQACSPSQHCFSLLKAWEFICAPLSYRRSKVVGFRSRLLVGYYNTLILSFSNHSVVDLGSLSCFITMFQ